MKKSIWIAIAIIVLIAVVAVIWSTRQHEPEEVRIGVILPLTGSAAELAVPHRQGLDLAIEQLNKAAEESNIRFRLIVEDDQNDPKTTVTALQRLLSVDKVCAVITVMSSPSMAIAPIVDQNAIPLFANCGHPGVTTLHKNVFRNFPSSVLEVRKMAEFASQTLSLRSAWMVYIDDAYGKGAEEVAREEFPKRGIHFLGSDAYGKASSDVRAALVRIVSEKPDAVYVYGYGKATAEVVNQLREVGYNGIILGSYNFSQPPLTTVSGKNIEGSYYTIPSFDYDGKTTAPQFWKIYEEKFHAAPLWNGAVEYDAIMILTKAVKKSREDGSSLTEALKKIGDFEGVAGAYKYDPSRREWLTPMSIAHIVGGKVGYTK